MDEIANFTKTHIGCEPSSVIMYSEFSWPIIIKRQHFFLINLFIIFLSQFNSFFQNNPRISPQKNTRKRKLVM
jgi:hypothetical protein